MSGEITGTSVILENGAGEIVGQGDFTLTFGGDLVDISNKSYGDNMTYLDGELSNKQLVFSGVLVYNDDTQYRKVRADDLTGTQDTYTITYGLTGESFTGLFAPNAMSDTLTKGTRVETSITFSSSGEYVHTPAS